MVPTRTRSFSMIASFAVLFGIAPVIGSSRADAATCTFVTDSNTVMTYDLNYPSTLKFTWDTSSGDVDDDPGTCNGSNRMVWDEYVGGVHVYSCGYATDPGSVETGSFSQTTTVRKTITLKYIYNSIVYTLRGWISGNAVRQSSYYVALSAISTSDSGGQTAIIAGYGNVTCN